MRLIGEYIATTGDGVAQEHYDALAARLDTIATEAQRAATTTVDSGGNITIGLSAVGMAATAARAGE